VVGDGNVTSGAVGRGQGPKGLKQVLVLNTGVNESACALGAAKLRAKTKESTAALRLKRLSIGVLIN